MADTVYETSDTLFVDLLNNACKNPAPTPGYWTYRVETHCTAVTYTAKVINRDHNNMPTRYRIIHRDYEAR